MSHLLTPDSNDATNLLFTVAEELKLPLLKIARQAELINTSENLSLGNIQAIADDGLKLIDNYLLGLRLSSSHELLDIESISVSSVLYDAMQELKNIARNYDVKLELNVAGKYGPVMANRQGLESVLVSLGSALIESLPAMEGQQLTLKLATHRSRYGIVAGVYVSARQVSQATLKRGRRLQTTSRQPLLDITHTGGAGVFVADAILTAMNLNLTSSRHHKWYGLATVLQPSPQLELIL